MVSYIALNNDDLEPLPLVTSVGEEVYLSCAAPIQDATTAVWTRVDGDLPAESNTTRGVLRLPSVSRDDEGKYQCTVVKDGVDTVSTVELHVHVFRGQESLTLPPLSDDEMTNLDVILTINTTGESGVIFETARRPSVPNEDPMSNARPPSLEHRARIDDGVLVYEYDVGYGKASLQLNSGPVTEKLHDTLVWQEGSSNGPVILGAHIDPTSHERTQQGFKGVISSLTVSGEGVPLGKAGYECVCPKEYAGEYCQMRSSFCKGEDCNSGICVELEDTWQCVCPSNTTGIRCEIMAESVLDSLGFNRDTSFVTMPSPKDLDQMEISMTVKPGEVEKEHILLYVAEDYNPDSSKHLSVSIVDGAIAYSYSDGTGREEMRTSPIEMGMEYVVALSRNNSATSLHVNGEVFTVEVRAYLITFCGIL
ncbi:EGF-like domain protein [Ancylostoma ceylanicum]|uniref:EGF-like domain protein n=1 Tax=Ancylostoma ceylanicum TaxID=53326 RepID=A0A0D6M7T3_9BILA|nr:EGF-like domain protein [Ancylostoma ceylanicum]